MQPRFFCFCYELDAPLLPGLIESIRRVYPAAPIHLIDDDARPIPRDTLARLPFDRVFYERSAFARRGNLNGPDCILGVIDTFSRHLRAGEQLVKVDPDFICLNPAGVRDLLATGYGCIAPQLQRYLFGGYFYAMRAEVLTQLRRILPARDAILAGAQEDITIGSLAYLAASMLNYAGHILPASQQVGPGCVQGAFNHAYEGSEREGYIKSLLDCGCLMLTLGNPGVTREQSLAAQTDLLAALSERSATPTHATA